jgi:uncharacterized protein (DUF1499 family)
VAVASVATASVALCLLALAPLGWRLGWWSFRFALLWIIPASGVVAAIAAAMALAALVVGWRQPGSRTLAVLVGVLGLSAGLVYLPLHYASLLDRLPPINDIATDTDNRPAFDATLAARAAAGGGQEHRPGPQLSELQKRAYPDIAPVRTELPPSEAFAVTLAVARAMPGWLIVAAEGDKGRIEASERSRWFGFTDDIVIRVAADGSGSRIDMRSASRVGTHDIGVNAARIRAYAAAFRREVGK